MTVDPAVAIGTPSLGSPTGPVGDPRLTGRSYSDWGQYASARRRSGKALEIVGVLAAVPQRAPRDSARVVDVPYAERGYTSRAGRPALSDVEKHSSAPLITYQRKEWSCTWST